MIGLKNHGRLNAYGILSDHNQTRWALALKGILSGLAAGLLVVQFRWCMEFGLEKSVAIYAYLRLHPLALIPWAGLIAAVGLAVARLIRFEPMACGSGIPQVEGMVIHGMKIRSWSVLAVRFLGGILTSFFGLSLGREGPSIQIGAASSQIVARKTCSNKMEKNYLITAGAAAGLSAAFGAPLSGIMFALEEVHRSFSGLILLTATAASLTSSVLATLVFGLKPILSFTQTPQLLPGMFVWLLPVGVISGLAGALINKSLLGMQTLYGRLPAKIRPALALLAALPFGLFLPQVMGGGMELINTAEMAKTGIPLLLLFLAAKLLFTCTSFGSGVPGGIFLPILSIGAITGSVIGLIATRFGLPASHVADFAICGMAGALSGSVKAPVTSILLTAEMTGSLVHLFPVAACSFLALFVSDFFKVKPIYEELLERTLKDRGEAVSGGKPGSIVEIPVEAGSAIAGKKIGGVELPKGILIVGIHRGDTDIVPNGATQIKPGDYLIVLSSELAFREANRRMRSLCSA